MRRWASSQCGSALRRSFLPGAVITTALLATALALRNRLPFFSLGVLWFFAAHFLTSNVVPFELVFEHRNYFAALGILLAVFDLVRRLPLRDGPGIMKVGVGAVLVGLMALCAIRADAGATGCCPADLDGSGAVDAADLAALLGAWGSAGGAADLDGSGAVDAADLAAMLGAWGGC